MTYRTRLLIALIHGCLVVLLVSACTATPISDPESLAQATPEVTIQGDTPGKEEVQTIELDNCGGKADATRIEQRTQSIDVTISTEVAGKIGASVEVVSAEVQAAVGLAITPGSERSTSIQLVAPPDTRMLFELVWVGNEQIGVVQNIRNSDVPVAFRSFLPTDVRIRSQSDIGCSGSSPPQVVFEPTAPPQTSVSTTEPFCAFVTQSQVEELKTFQDVASAIRKAEEFAGYRQNDYIEGSTIPAGVLIATDLLSTNLEQFGVIPINNQGGWGLFVTAREIQAPNAGTYWCIQEADTGILLTPVATLDPICDTRTTVREPADQNERKTYIRCPVGEIQYSIQVDDILESIILDCPGASQQTIAFSKNESRSAGQLLPTFDSEKFTSHNGCKIHITIVNGLDQIGYTIWQEVVGQP